MTTKLETLIGQHGLKRVLAAMLDQYGSTAALLVDLADCDHTVWLKLFERLPPSALDAVYQQAQLSNEAILHASEAAIKAENACLDLGYFPYDWPPTP